MCLPRRSRRTRLTSSVDAVCLSGSDSYHPQTRPLRRTWLDHRHPGPGSACSGMSRRRRPPVLPRAGQASSPRRQRDGNLSHLFCPCRTHVREPMLGQYVSVEFLFDGANDENVEVGVRSRFREVRSDEGVVDLVNGHDPSHVVVHALTSPTKIIHAKRPLQRDIRIASTVTISPPRSLSAFTCMGEERTQVLGRRRLRLVDHASADFL